MLIVSGINMEYYPMMFSYSYPLEALKFKRAQYFDAGVTDGIPAPSGSEHITSVR
jgi:hypothetical protein